MAHDVFISYCGKDKAVADAVCAALEQRAVRCWVAPRDVLPGAVWSESIVDAIDEARLLVVVFSATANTSQQVMREVERAVHLGRPVLPLRIEDVEMAKAFQYFLGVPHWLDALTPPLEHHLDRLVASVGRLLERPVASVSSPSDQSHLDQQTDTTGLPSPLEELPLDDWGRRGTSRRGLLSRFFDDH